MKSNYQTSVSLACQICGGKDFDVNDDKTFVKCNTCNREYPGGIAELKQMNEQRVQAAVEQLGQNMVADVEKELKKKLRKFKSIKLK